MTEADAPNLREVLLRLKAGITELDPQQVGSVLALVDRAADRDRYEPLLDAIRPKLRADAGDIPRPASLGRVLFLPVEKLLVSPAGWKPGQLTIPRSTLHPIIRELPGILGRDYERLQEALQDRTMRDVETIMRVGDSMWPVVGTALLAFANGKPSPLAPSNIPMSEAYFRRFCGAIGEVLPLGQLLVELSARDVTSERFSELGETALGRAASVASVDAVRRVGIVCLIEGWQRQLAPSFVASLLRRAGIGESEETLAPALGAAIDALGASINVEFRVIESAPLALSRRAAALADRVAAALDDRMLSRASERSRELKALAERCEAMFRSVVEHCLSQDCHAKLVALAQEREIPDSAIEAVERAARAVTEIVRAARTLAPRTTWPEALCQETTARLTDMARHLPAGCPRSRLGRRDVARIIEILSGPDAAMALETDDA